MSRVKMYLRLMLFILIVTSLLLYQQHRKNELITYLQAINTCFTDMESLQKISIEASKAGMSGNQAKEMEINADLLRRSEAFLLPFTQVETPGRAIANIHTLLVELNQSTHELLVYRIEVLSKIKDGALSNDEKQTTVALFWQMQSENQKLYRKLGDLLHKQAKQCGIKIPDYLSNFAI